MSCLDPYDDLIMRVIVGRCVGTMARMLDGSDVSSYPLARNGQGWTYTEPRKANRARRAKAALWQN